MSIVALQQQFKDHTVDNAVMDMNTLPLNARDVHMQPIRNMKVTIQVLDEEDGRVIETITGKATDGSIKMDSTSLIRRTGSITLSVEPDLFPSPDSLMWFGNYLRIYVGIRDLRENSDHYVNFLLGTFWIDEGNYTIDASSSSITIAISDKMTKYDESQLEYQMIIPTGTPIVDALRMVMENVGETEFGKMENPDASMVVPYDLEYGVGEQVTTVITALRDMYMDCYCGYDLQGRFEFRQITVQRADDVAEPKWRFDSTANDRADLTVSFQEGYNLKAIRNHILVYGGMSEMTGITPYGEIRLTDSKSPFNVDAIGNKKKVIVESKYVTDDQCIARARYEIWRTSNFQETATITAVPIYILDANDILEITHPETNEVHRYMLDTYSMNLGINGEMTITAHKLYYVGLEYGEEMIPIIESFIKGINNFGWISLAEERINACYNMMGSGQNQLTIRFVEGQLGGHQASITSYATTKNQTLQIDIKDFEGLIDGEENGDNGRSAGDYADRVIGHEMFHAVMNEYFGHEVAIEMPVWFRESWAEFLHGARERFASVYNSRSRIEKKVELINLAEKVMRGYWLGTSEEYVASYLIAIAIYRIAKRKNMWTNLFIRLKNQTNISINFLLKFLPVSETNDGVIEMIVNEMMGMEEVWNMLYDTNETDTGSIGGIHFMNLYNSPLTAKSVFNNSNAMVDSIGFLLRIEK